MLYLWCIYILNTLYPLGIVGTTRIREAVIFLDKFVIHTCKGGNFRL